MGLALTLKEGEALNEGESPGSPANRAFHPAEVLGAKVSHEMWVHGLDQQKKTTLCFWHVY